jgi:hypothetical protein
MTPTADRFASFAAKQDALVSGTNIKTINSTSLLGSGDLTVSASQPELNITRSISFGGF